MGALGPSPVRREDRRTGGRSNGRIRTDVAHEQWVAIGHEAQVARLARDGLSTSEIDQCLFISQRTVAHHLRMVFSKLGITSRSLVAIVAVRTPSARSFAIRQAHHVDRNKRVAEVVGKHGNGGVYLRRLRSRFRPQCVSVLHKLELIWKKGSSRSPRSSSTSAQGRVPQCPQQTPTGRAPSKRSSIAARDDARKIDSQPNPASSTACAYGRLGHEPGVLNRRRQGVQALPSPPSSGRRCSRLAASRPPYEHGAAMRPGGTSSGRPGRRDADARAGRRGPGATAVPERGRRANRHGDKRAAPAGRVLRARRRSKRGSTLTARPHATAASARVDDGRRTSTAARLMRGVQRGDRATACRRGPRPR
jgi:DNA-binding CsgD family transcriptional regulator